MNAYRDQYAQLFGNDNSVKVLAISADADTTTASWAKEANYPVTFVSDTGKVAGKAYSVMNARGTGFGRVLFVVGKDGNIAHVMRPFRELVQDSYDELGTAVQAAKKK
jgi:peroxiredoxin